MTGKEQTARCKCRQIFYLIGHDAVRSCMHVPPLSAPLTLSLSFAQVGNPPCFAFSMAWINFPWVDQSISQTDRPGFLYASDSPVERRRIYDRSNVRAFKDVVSRVVHCNIDNSLDCECDHLQIAVAIDWNWRPAMPMRKRPCGQRKAYLSRLDEVVELRYKESTNGSVSSLIAGLDAGIEAETRIEGTRHNSMVRRQGGRYP